MMGGGLVSHSAQSGYESGRHPRTSNRDRFADVPPPRIDRSVPPRTAVQAGPCAHPPSSVGLGTGPAATGTQRMHCGGIFD